MTLAVWRQLLGLATYADRWLAQQFVSDACLSRLWKVKEKA